MPDDDVKPNAARARIDAHLDAVDLRLMSTGMPRNRRRGIVDDLQAQIADMLAAAGAHPPSVADVECVLGRLDPVCAYGADAASTAPPSAPAQISKTTTNPAWQPVPTTHVCPAARVGAVLTGVGATAGMVLLSMGVPGYFATPLVSDARSPAVQCLLAIAMAVATVGLLAGTVAGWSAIGRIQRSAGGLTGIGRAVVATAGAPLSLLWIASFWLCYGAMGMAGSFGVHPQRPFLGFYLAWTFSSSVACAAFLSLLIGHARRPSTTARRSLEPVEVQSVRRLVPKTADDIGGLI